LRNCACVGENSTWRRCLPDRNPRRTTSTTADQPLPPMRLTDEGTHESENLGVVAVRQAPSQLNFSTPWVENSKQ